MAEINRSNLRFFDSKNNKTLKFNAIINNTFNKLKLYSCNDKQYQHRWFVFLLF